MMVMRLQRWRRQCLQMDNWILGHVLPIDSEAFLSLPDCTEGQDADCRIGTIM